MATNEPSNASTMAVDKPRGLANMEHHPHTINTFIEDFEYRDEGSGAQSDEDGEDDLEYPGGMAESLVRLFSPDHLQQP